LRLKNESLFQVKFRRISSLKLGTKRLFEKDCRSHMLAGKAQAEVLLRIGFKAVG